MKNLLVTGGAGSIGVNLIRFLLEEGEFSGRIVNLDNLTYAGNLESLKGLEEKFPRHYVFEKADICDEKKVSEIFDRYEIDAVIHLAAESHVDRSLINPDLFIRTNILGTFNLLEISRRNIARLKRFHHVSTDEVFGSLDGGNPFSEGAPYRPNSPYSASKASADHLVRAFIKSYGLPATVSNSTNNYGPYHHPEKLIPLCIVNALEGKAIPVYGDGLHVRDWLYVRDHCRALWLILQKGVPGEFYNVGSRNEVANLEVVRMICDYLDELKPLPHLNSRRDLITFVKDRPGHDRRYGLDSTKIHEELGFQAEEDFPSGLKKTIRWYLEHPQWVSAARNDEFKKWVRIQYPMEERA